MELRHLRYFAGVAHYLNYSEASRRLHVAQPAISQTILDLEDEVGVKLLSRTKRTVQLTAAGTVFFREVEEILRRANEAGQLARRAGRGEIGTLDIGFFGAASAPILPPLVRSYRRKFPDVQLHLYQLNPDQQLAAFDEGDVQLHLYQLNPDQQLAAFDEGRIDLGFSRKLPRDRRAEFEEEEVYADELVIALPAAHPQTRQKVVRLKALAGEAFVQFHRGGVRSVFDEVIAICRRAGFSPRIVNEPDFMATVITLVESGLGISLVPRCVRTLNRPGVVIRRISPKSPRIPLCIVWRKSAQNPALAAFLEILRTARPKIRKEMEL
jgi:DNA-binding transcriptional LysR family regulator